MAETVVWRERGQGQARSVAGKRDLFDGFTFAGAIYAGRAAEFVGDDY